MKVVILPYFHTLNFKGFKLQLKGKIGVSGNARTRTLFYQIGQTSHATMDNKMDYTFTLINTFTGVLGFQV
jgi:ribosomal protein S3